MEYSVEILAEVYIWVSLIVFLVSLVFSRRIEGRCYTDEIEWEGAFVTAILWPIFLLLLVVIAFIVLRHWWPAKPPGACEGR